MFVIGSGLYTILTDTIRVKSKAKILVNMYGSNFYIFNPFEQSNLTVVEVVQQYNIYSTCMT